MSGANPHLLKVLMIFAFSDNLSQIRKTTFALSSFDHFTHLCDVCKKLLFSCLIVCDTLLETSGPELWELP